MFAILGEALMDMVIKEDGHALDAHFGGGPFNTALALAKLEQKTYFHYPLSQDYYGRRFHNYLLQHDIIYSCPYVSPYSTPLAMVHIDKDGKADYRFYRHHTAERDLRLSCLMEALPKDIKAIHTGTLAIAEQPDSDIIKNLLKQAKSRGVVVSVDPNIRAKNFDDKDDYRRHVKQMMQLADIIKCSDDDVAFLYPKTDIESAINHLFADYQHVPLMVVTAGKDYIKAKAQKAHLDFIPQFTSIAGDTIGAGDCFIAGLLYQCHKQGLLSYAALANLNQAQLKDMITIADKVAALNCQTRGCNPPSLSQL